MQIAEFFGAYYVIGVLWGFVKWYLFVLDQREVYDTEKVAWLATRRVKDTSRVPDHLRNEWRNYVRVRKPPMAERPLARTNKQRIVRWISFWPVSLLWTIVDDFVKRIAEALYRMIAGWYQHVANLAWQSVDADLADSPKTPDPEV